MQGKINLINVFWVQIVFFKNNDESILFLRLLTYRDISDDLIFLYVVSNKILSELHKFKLRANAAKNFTHKNAAL